MIALLAGACSDDTEPEPTDVHFCVRTVWESSRGSATRVANTSLLDDDATAGIELILPSDAYPEEISVSCNGKDFKLTRTVALTECTEHSGFINGYTSDYPLKDIEAKKGVTATATMDGGDELYCENNDIELDGTHLKFTMHHKKTLLRFAFKVNDKYDQIRYIKITGIQLNGIDCNLVEKVLNKATYQLIAYAYIDPAEVTKSTTNTLACTYNIYDKDDATDAHLTRKGVVAKNTFTLGSLKDLSDINVSNLLPGYYYDLRVTLNPDYLYVLSEHDNKHIVIN